MKKSFLSFALLLTAAKLVFGQSAADKPHISTIRVNADATVSATPDQATMNIGVQSRSENAATAASQNATKLERVLAEVRKVLGGKGEIKTTEYSLNPNYVYPPQGGEPKLTGYIATNSVQIKTEQLDLVGKIIDAATQAGSNKVDYLAFGLKNETAAESQALKDATRRARQKADAIAEALGVKIRRIVALEEGGGPRPIPYAETRMMKAEAAMDAETPVEPGKIEVHATVSLTAEIE